jgi:4-hydroxybutyrate CoA-transferase
MDVKSLYLERLTTPEDAVREIESDARVYLGGGAGVPQVLARALLQRAGQVENVEITSVLTFANGEYLAPEYARSFRHRGLFLGENARAAVNEGRGDYVPVFLSEIPGLFCNRELPIDIALIQVSPPDAHGFCSFGVEVGVTKPAANPNQRAGRSELSVTHRSAGKIHGHSQSHWAARGRLDSRRRDVAIGHRLDS